MKKILILLAACICILQSHAQKKTYWKPLTTFEAAKTQNFWGNKFKPAAYKLFRLDEAVLSSELKATPSENEIQAGKQGKIITVPDADGKLQEFRVGKTALMEPALTSKYPGIKTYTGKGIDDASAVIRFSITPSGFHAMVTATGKPTFYINVLDKKSNVYAVNARNENDAVNGFTCSIDQSVLKHNPSTSKASTLTGNADDSKLRQYRLALCVNGEFSQVFLDGSEADTAAMKAKVLNAMIVLLERANETYERDFGIRMVFADNEDTLIYLNPSTDPWPTRPPLFGSSWNTKTQQAINLRIGAANYDIGHLLGKVPLSSDNNGNANCIGCVCNNADKGSAFTAYNNPTLTDYLVIDYWAHEMGHQFGANHTFTFTDEDTQAQIEPGSGSTIMGYAGITGNTDVQEHSDDLFSVVSIAQVTENIKNGVSSACAAVSSTNNNIPVVDGGADYTIPFSTPFVLTGTAADADAGDDLAYIWEQADFFQAGSNKFPNTQAITGPIFRTYNYTTSPVRYFPDMAYILNGDLGWKWEVLPGVGRELNFRFTARDNHAGGGANKSDEVLLTVDSLSGPFQVTVQNASSAETWHGNETKTITWDVNNTDAAPVNCSNVNILLSLDGGLTFPTVLAANTANDGTEDITVPNLSTTQARIKIEAVGNIFFTISNIDFAIESTLPVTWLSLTAQKLNNASVLVKWSTVNELNNKFYVVERSTDEFNFSASGQVTAGNNPATVQQYSFTDFKAVAGVNYYRIKQVDADGKSSYSGIAKVILPGDILTWSVQPNPVKTYASFYARKNMSGASVILADMSGKIVYTSQRKQIAAGEQIFIPVAHLAKGIYIIKVSSTEETRSEKLVIE